MGDIELTWKIKINIIFFEAGGRRREEGRVLIIIFCQFVNSSEMRLKDSENNFSELFRGETEGWKEM